MHKELRREYAEYYIERQTEIATTYSKIFDALVYLENSGVSFDAIMRELKENPIHRLDTFRDETNFILELLENFIKVIDNES